MKDAPAQTTRNKFFYSQSVVFKVEDELFRVPKNDFVDSSDVFNDMFLLPPGSETTVQEGDDDEHPIELAGYDKADFESLLKVMSPRTFWSKDAITRSTLGITLAKEEWIGVLKLSTAWVMPKIRAYAIQRLDEDFVLPPAQRLQLGRLYKVATWIHCGLTALLGTKGLSLDDLTDLDWDTKACILSMDMEQRPGYYGFRLDDIHCKQCNEQYPPGAFPAACVSCLQPLDSATRLHWEAPQQDKGLVGTGWRTVRCRSCGKHPTTEDTLIDCGPCGRKISRKGDWWIKIRLSTLDETIEKHFGEEIKQAQAAWRVSEPGSPSNNP